MYGFGFERYKEQLTKINAYDDYKKVDLSNVNIFMLVLIRIYEEYLKKCLIII